jgi:hypothetical protein
MQARMRAFIALALWSTLRFRIRIDGFDTRKKDAPTIKG